MSKLSAAIVPVTPFQQNCTILCDREVGHGTVIDPGGDVDAILARIAALGVAIDSILLTHGHLDHAGGAAELRDRLPLLADGGKMPVIGPDARDDFLLAGIDEQAREYGVPGLHSVTPDRYLSEGDTVTIAGAPFAVLHCPGHTPGHVVFVSAAHKLAIVGDVLFRGSIGRTDLPPYGDHAALLASIHDKLLPLGDDINFLCGHGPGSSFGRERLENPFLTGGA